VRDLWNKWDAELADTIEADLMRRAGPDALNHKRRITRIASLRALEEPPTTWPVPPPDRGTALSIGGSSSAEPHTGPVTRVGPARTNGNPLTRPSALKSRRRHAN